MSRFYIFFLVLIVHTTQNQLTLCYKGIGKTEAKQITEQLQKHIPSVKNETGVVISGSIPTPVETCPESARKKLPSPAPTSKIRDPRLI